MRTNEEIYAQSKTANIPEIMAEAQREALEAYKNEISDIMGKMINSGATIHYIGKIDINKFINGGIK